MFEDWEDKYEHLIDIGKKLPQLSAEHKTKVKLINGCQSPSWLHSTFSEGKVFFEADSESTIPKGMIALMIRVLSGHTPNEIINAKLEFINIIGLRKQLSPLRANGLESIIKRMKLDAFGFVLSE